MVDCRAGTVPPVNALRLKGNLLDLVSEFKVEEKTIICTNCGNPFVFSLSEQERFVALGFTEPKRCRECRKNRLKPESSRHEMKFKDKRRQPRHQWESID